MAKKINMKDATLIKADELPIGNFESTDNVIGAKGGLMYRNSFAVMKDKIVGQLQDQVDSLQFEGAKTYQKLIDLQAVDPVPSEGTAAKVANDPIESNNGYYSVVSGSWTKDADLYENKAVPENTTKGITGLASVRESQKTAVEQGSYIFFNGSNAKMQLDKDYVLSSDGDYVEFRFELLDSNSNSRYGIFGKLTAGNEQDIGLDVTGSVTKVYTLKVRGGNSTWNDFVLKDSYYSRNRYRIEIANSATELNLYENGTLTDTQPFTGGNLIIRDIASAYSTHFTKMNLHHFKIHSAADGDVVSLSKTIELSTFQNLISIQPEIKYSNCYVDYQMTASSTGNEKFTVFSRVGKTNKYIGFEIEHELDMSELVYTDQWRIKKAFAYEFDGETMISLGVECLQGGESESVYKRVGKDDFSGGFHGDELATSIGFYLDGVRLPASYLNAEFSLLPCGKFSYNQVSTVHTASTGGVPAPGHPVEAKRTKRTSFYEGSYDTEISYTWQMAISDFEDFFSSLSSISVGYANYGENSKLDNFSFQEDGEYVLTDIGGEWMRQYHLSQKRSVTVVGWASINNDVANNKIWDIATYHKYYRDIKAGNVLEASIGDVWKMKTKVSFRL